MTLKRFVFQSDELTLSVKQARFGTRFVDIFHDRQHAPHRWRSFLSTESGAIHYDCRIRIIASVIAFAFVSKASMATTALTATLSTPFSDSHLVISSIAAPRAC